MSHKNCQVNITVNEKTYSICYSYRSDSTFQDLLEYFAFLCRELKICQCYNFRIGGRSNQAQKISKNYKLNDYSNYLNNLQLYIDINGNKCVHSEKNYLNYTKLYIYSEYQKLKDCVFSENKLTQNIVLNEEKPKFVDFYDVIVHIDSIKDINKGWNIEMNEKGAKIYNECKKIKLLKIGMIGNANKGKSFLLSKISKIKLPSGMTIRTEGLSIKYPDLSVNKNRTIALLDSAGLETPVLVSDLELEKDKKELFREKSREKLITELFFKII